MGLINAARPVHVAAAIHDPRDDGKLNVAAVTFSLPSYQAKPTFSDGAL